MSNLVVALIIIALAFAAGALYYRKNGKKLEAEIAELKAKLKG